MKQLQRIKTIIIYSWYHLNHSLETWVDLVWFPVIEVLVFGLLANFLDAGAGRARALILLGLIFWEVIRVVQYSITVGVMWDVWSRNFTTLFVSPLKMRELIAGHVISGVLKAIFMICLLTILAFFLYGFSFLPLSLPLIFYFFLLTLFSASAGMVVVALVLRFGTDIQSLSWSLIYLFQPISAMFYPVSALPEKIRFVAYVSPITYVMESAREHS